MKRLPLSEARETLSDTVNRVAYQGERVILDCHGKGVAALVSVEDLALLEELEDKLDLEAFRKAKREWERDGKQSFSLDEVTCELGIKA